MNNASIRAFIISKLPWIEKHAKRFKEQPKETQLEYVSGESHHFKGERYLLNVIEYVGKPYITINNKQYIDFYVKKNMDSAHKDRIFLRWYRKELDSELFNIFAKWQNIMGVSISEWRIKRMWVFPSMR